jgi:hypothetical protein
MRQKRSRFSQMNDPKTRLVCSREMPETRLWMRSFRHLLLSLMRRNDQSLNGV